MPDPNQMALELSVFRAFYKALAKGGEKVEKVICLVNCIYATST